MVLRALLGEIEKFCSESKILKILKNGRASG